MADNVIISQEVGVLRYPANSNSIGLLSNIKIPWLGGTNQHYLNKLKAVSPLEGRLDFQRKNSH